MSADGEWLVALVSIRRPSRLTVMALPEGTAAVAAAATAPVFEDASLAAEFDGSRW